MALAFGLVTQPGINNVNNSDSLIDGANSNGLSETTGGGNDILRGSKNGGNILSGGLGNDRLLGGEKDDILDGGDGNDWLSGGAGNDTILGGVGNDVLKGGLGEDSLDGGIGDDWLSGGEGDDILTGGAGKDVFQFGVGSWRDAVNFSAQIGHDTITDFNAAEDRIDLSSLFARCTDASVQTFIEQMQDLVQQEARSLTVGKGPKAVTYSDASVDVLHGDVDEDGVENASNTLLNYNKATKELDYKAQYGSYSGTLKGINGETYDYTIEGSNSNGLKGLTISLQSSASNDDGGRITLLDVNDLSAANFVMDDKKLYVADKVVGANDGIGETLDFSTNGNKVGMVGAKGVTVIASDEKDVITGTDKADAIWGNGGNDIIHGGAGRDELRGGGGDDLLNGGTDSDFLHGGTGKNFLWGGSGADRFVFGGTIDDAGKFKLDAGVTHVMDYRWGEGDKIKFANLGDGYTGTLEFSKLEQKLDIGSLLTRENTQAYDQDGKIIAGKTVDSLVVTTGGAKYIIDDFFGEVWKSTFGTGKTIGKGVADLDWVKDHTDFFFM